MSRSSCTMDFLIAEVFLIAPCAFQCTSLMWVAALCVCCCGSPWRRMCVILKRVVIENRSMTFTYIWKRILVAFRKAGFRNNFPSSVWRVWIILIRAVLRKNSIVYTVSVLIASMAASIIFLSACTRRVFPVEIFLSRDLAPLRAMCIVSSSSSICSSSVCWCCVCGLLIGWHWLDERHRFVLFADVAIGNSFIDGTNGFVHALVVCCGAGTIFAGSDFLFCMVFGIEFLAVGFDCFVHAFIVCLMAAGVVMGIYGWHERGRVSASFTVNVAHAFDSGMWAGFLLSCFSVVRCDAGAVFSFFSASILFGQTRLVACSCPQFAHLNVNCLLSLYWWEWCLPAQYLQVWISDLHVLAWWAYFWQLKHCWGPFIKGRILKLPYPLVNLTECSFPVKTTFTMTVWFANFILLFHCIIRVASSTISSCRSSSSVMQDGTPIRMYVFLNIVSMGRKEHSLWSTASLNGRPWTSKEFPVRVIGLTTFTHGYIRWSSASISASVRKLPRFIPNFWKVSSVSVFLYDTRQALIWLDTGI